MRVTLSSVLFAWVLGCGGKPDWGEGTYEEDGQCVADDGVVEEPFGAADGDDSSGEDDTTGGDSGGSTSESEDVTNSGDGGDTESKGGCSHIGAASSMHMSWLGLLVLAARRRR